MRTLLIAGSPAPDQLRDIVRAGSTEVIEVTGSPSPQQRAAADRLVIWSGPGLMVDDRDLRWPDDADEVKMLFQTGG